MKEHHVVVSHRVNAQVCPQCHTVREVHFRSLLITARKTRWACYNPQCLIGTTPYLYDVAYEVDE